MKFYLKNVGTMPIRDYTLTVHVAPEVPKYLVNGKPKDGQPVTISFSGPNVVEWHAATEGDRFGGKTSVGDSAKSADCLLLPGRPRMCVGEIEFWFGSSSNDFRGYLSVDPIRLEYCGGTGPKKTR